MTPARCVLSHSVLRSGLGSTHERAWSYQEKTAAKIEFVAWTDAPQRYEVGALTLTFCAP